MKQPFLFGLGNDIEILYLSLWTFEKRWVFEIRNVLGHISLVPAATVTSFLKVFTRMTSFQISNVI